MQTKKTSVFEHLLFGPISCIFQFIGNVIISSSKFFNNVLNLRLLWVNELTRSFSLIRLNALKQELVKSL